MQSRPNRSGARPGPEVVPDRHPPERPGPPEPPDPQTAAAARRLILNFTLLILAALVTASLPLPVQAAALLFSIAAIVVGARALRVAWRPGLREQLAPLLVLGLVFAALLTLSLAAVLALWPVQMEHQTCLSRALTLGARQDCETQYEESVTERLDELSRRITG